MTGNQACPTIPFNINFDFVEPIVVAYSVTDINAHITRAVKSNAANIRKNSFVKILSEPLAFIDNEFVINDIKKIS